MSLFHSIWTLALFLVFIGIVVWAWSRRNKKRFDDAANIPFKDEDDGRGDNKRG